MRDSGGDADSVNPIPGGRRVERLILQIASPFEKRSKEIERFIKFLIVGMVTWLLDFAVLNLLQSTFLMPEKPYETLKVFLASGTAFVVAVVTNFIWNRHWTFGDVQSHHYRQQLARFCIATSIGWIFRSVFIASMYKPLGQIAVEIIGTLRPEYGFGLVTPNQIGTNVAQAIAIVIVLFWNFLASRFWTFAPSE
ncbi:MAG: hypothetical protein Kow0063_25930 [Anaerolineae bacterium]